MKNLFIPLFLFFAFVSHAQTVSISSSVPSNIICSGNSVTFTANTTGFTNPNYQWYLNGGAISGATNSTYTSNSLTNNDGINVKVTEGPAGSITTNGLILNLDATNPLSYPGSGTTWNNLVTGNAVTEFTIQSAGTYSTDNGGVIRFGNTKIGAGASSSTGFSNLSTYTVEVWVKPAGTMGDYDPSVEGNTNYTPCFFAEKVHSSGAGNRVNMVLAYNARGLTNGTANNSYRYEAAINNGSWKKYQIQTDYSSDLNNWVQILCTYNGSTMTIYRNGVSLGTSPALGVSSLRTPSIGYWIAHRWDMNDGVYGDYSKVMMYDRALSAAEVSSNYTAFNARFVSSGVSSSTINTTVYASPSIPAITMEGDACINKTTLSTPTGLSYIWYKDNVAISNTNSSTYAPTTAGDYKVQVTNGSCSNQSTTTTISTCGVTADGRMQAITSPTTLVSQEGGINFGTGVSELGTTVNATGIGTTLGTISATAAVVRGVISSTNAVTSSIGVIYSTDSNFGTYATSSTQSNVAASTYAFTLSGLSSTTTYHAKSFIVNKAGTSYGAVISFTTLAEVPPTKVAITRASVGTGYGLAFTTQPQVSIQDVSGNTVTTSSAVVTATISSGGTLVGTTTATASSGVATFSNLGIKGTATAYTITYTVSGLTTATQSVTPTALSIGSTGPGGGKVFYAASSSGFACGPNLNGTCYYLEVAPIEANATKEWAALANRTSLAGASGTVIGSGYPNTMAIINQGNSGSAAAYAQAYRGGGLSDWYQGSTLEMYQIYVNRAAVIIGTAASHGFAGEYWTSTEVSASQAYSYDVTNDSGPWPNSKNSNPVRPIRSF